MILFNPSRQIIWLPNTKFDNLFINSLNAWHFKNNAEAPVILFCHGNSGNISHRGYVNEFCRLTGLNLFIFDYNGYGLSSGRPSIHSILDNGLTIYKYLAKHYNPAKIIVWGESLGGAVAIYIAARCQCYRLLAMSTFSSLSDTVRYDPNFIWPLSSIISEFIKIFMAELPSKQYIKSVTCPVAIIHSPDDTVIPYKCGQILYDSIQHNDKIFVTISGDHSSPIITMDNLKRIIDFCNIKCNLDFANEWLNKLQYVWKNHSIK